MKKKRKEQAEIEITPEMIEAGVEVLREHCPDTAVGDSLDRQMVREIYGAMRSQGMRA